MGMNISMVSQKVHSTMITNIMLLFYTKIYEEPSIHLQLLTCNLWDAKESQVGCKGSMTL